MKNLMGKVNSKMRENKRNGRRALKGFTLVEIIVVSTKFTELSTLLHSFRKLPSAFYRYVLQCLAFS